MPAYAQKNTWVFQTIQFRDQNKARISPSQTEVLNNVVNEIKSEWFNGNFDDQAIRKVYSQVSKAFNERVAAQIFGQISTHGVADLAKRDYECGCSTSWAAMQCPENQKCVPSAGTCTASNGCGAFKLYDCDGVCQAI